MNDTNDGVLNMQYKFYGWENVNNIHSVNKGFGVDTPLDLYDKLRNIWCEYSCAPRMRQNWSEDNITLGQCSITAFLAQDIFGGQVHGILRSDGSIHCYNVVNGITFDLTSEQFQGEALNYSQNPEQLREVHFLKDEKRQRYEYLKSELSKRSSR